LELASGLRPVYDRQSGNGSKVAILRNHGAVSEAASDGGDLHVDLLHRAADPAQFRVQPAEFVGRRLVVWPDAQLPQMVSEPDEVYVA
jgi:hypothetical protein